LSHRLLIVSPALQAVLFLYVNYQPYLVIAVLSTLLRVAFSCVGVVLLRSVPGCGPATCYWFQRISLSESTPLLHPMS